MKRKVISWIVISFMLLMQFPQIVFADIPSVEGNGPISKKVTVYGSGFGNNRENPFNTELVFDDAWLSSACPAVYNGGLAVFSSILSADQYSNTDVAVEDAAEADKTSFLTSYGFEDVIFFRVPESSGEDESAVDPDDEANVLIGHKLTEQDNRKYDMVIVAVQGTDPSLAQTQWSSSFDVGSTGQNYKAATGEHPDWKNSENHKGFDIVANRINSALEQYVGNLEHDGDVETSYLFTGHSRGAAAANILGAMYEENGEKSCAYTFASPETTTAAEEKASAYGTVFNHINTNDFVSELPLKHWGFRRYGRDLELDIRSAIDSASADYDEDVRNTVLSVLGEGGYAAMENLDQLMDPLSIIAEDRDDLYVNTHEGDIVTQSFESEKRMDSEYQTFQTAIDGLGLEKFAAVEKSTDGNNEYTVTRTVSPAVFMHGLGKLIADYRGGDTIQLMGDYMKILVLLQDTRYSEIMSEIMNVIMKESASVSSPHYSVNGFAIAGYYQKKNAENDLSHHWGEWQVEKEPTTEEEGIRERSCSVCGYLETETVEKLPIPENLPFDDVQDKTAWYYGPVEYVYRQGIMKGMTDTHFDVGGKLSRAQFATILYRIEGSPAVASESVFTDIEAGQWYSDPVVWGSEKGIIRGYDDGRFGPSDSITREQIAALMYRYAGSPELDQGADLSVFNDQDDISAYALDAVKWCVGRGLINGMGDGTLAPQGNTTRGQCSAIIQRYMAAVH